MINAMLLPKWLHRVILMLSNRYSHKIDAPFAHFVRQPKGSESSCLAHCVSMPPKQGGLGLHHMRWLGCNPPWEKSLTKCMLCGKWHSSTPHGRLAQC